MKRSTFDLHDDLKDLLIKMRKERNFNPNEFIDSCVKGLNSRMEKYNIDTCIIEASDSVDFAVTLGLIVKAKSMIDSPIKKIVPVIIPTYIETQMVEEHYRVERSKRICNFFNIEGNVVQLGNSVDIIKENVYTSFDMRVDNKSYLDLNTSCREVILKHVQSLYLSIYNRPIIVSTRSLSDLYFLKKYRGIRDEVSNAYLVSKLYKSQLYDIAKVFEVPLEFLGNAVFTDLVETETIEEVTGVSYDFIELYSMFLDNYNSDKRIEVLGALSDDALCQFEKLSVNLERLLDTGNMYSCYFEYVV